MEHNKNFTALLPIQGLICFITRLKYISRFARQHPFTNKEAYVFLPVAFTMASVFSAVKRMGSFALVHNCRPVYLCVRS